MGIEIGWKSSEASSVADDWRGGPRFFLRLRRSGQFAGGGAARLETMGMAYLAAGGAGEMADVYYDAIQEFANSYRLEAADEILGYAIAHEFGHLLLGPAHAPAGIMSAVWRSKEWNAIHQGGLKFGKAERAAMQRELRKIEDRARPVSK